MGTTGPVRDPIPHRLIGPDDLRAFARRSASEAVVAFEADHLDVEEHLGWSVVVTGVARLVKDPAEAARYKDIFHPWVAGEMDQVIRIRPEIITGFELVPAAVSDERFTNDPR
ncbi:pyridoxamine 5'-phosphate oxidase family protein [Nonomuraea sp. NPDC050022]|uniref:pyridoxamine 5'-phosphate oxidase family protein n=1 Tax=unclassified Nonomuraea TaxID=2593643 RepID=UPI0033D68968